jgi:alpha-glucosidase
MSIPGWPADFQPQCQVAVFFQVNLTTEYGQNAFMSGNVTALGQIL